MTLEALHERALLFSPRRLLASTTLLMFLLVALGRTASAQLGEDEVWIDGPPYQDVACQGPDELDCQPGPDRTVPDVDVDGQARTVVTWRVSENSGDIYVRRFDFAGNPLEDPIAVATDGCRQNAPRVAAGTDGSFVVVWIHIFNPSDGDCPATRGANVYSIRSRYFDSEGNPGTEQIASQLDPSFAGGDHQPDIAALAGGNFAVVWKSSAVGSGDTNRNIQGRLLNATGMPIGDQFQVNTTTQGSQNDVTIDALPASDPDGPYDGGFVVAWRTPEIHIRRFESDGTASEDDRPVDTETGARLQVAVDENSGSVAVTWYRDSAIWVRLLDSNLNAITPVSRVSQVSDSDADDPSIADMGPLGFYIAWNSSSGVGDDNSASSIQARMLSRDGTFESGQFQVNTWIDNNQTSPRLGSAAGRLGIAWRSSGNPYDQPGDDHILGYLLNYPSCLFCDRFEG